LKHKYVIYLPSKLEDGDELLVGVITWMTEDVAQHLANNGYKVYLVFSRVPNWAIMLGLKTPWRFCVDIFNFRNPFRTNARTEEKETH
jgi:hypothetical protein